VITGDRPEDLKNLILYSMIQSILVLSREERRSSLTFAKDIDFLRLLNPEIHNGWDHLEKTKAKNMENFLNRDTPPENRMKRTSKSEEQVMKNLEELQIPFEMDKEQDNERMKIFLPEQNIAIVCSNFMNATNRGKLKYYTVRS